MGFPIVIIKYIPGARRGGLHGYRVSKVWGDHRDEFAVIAHNGIEALKSVDGYAAQRARHAGQVAA